MVAAAIIGGALVAGTAEVAAGSMAGGATTSATNAAIAEQNKALQQQATLAAPYTGVGQAAIPQYEALLGLGTGGNNASTLAALQNTPGYQFAQQQGETGVLNAASASGGVGGDTLAALDTFNTGLAEGTYQSAVGNAQNAVGLGQAAAAGQAANIGNAATNISNLTTAQGQNIAGIDANLAAALGQNVAQAGNQYTTAQTLAALKNQTPAAAPAASDPGLGPG
jgi:hypothetical protein